MLTDRFALNHFLQALSRSVSVDSGLSAGTLVSLARKVRGAGLNAHYYAVPSGRRNGGRRQRGLPRPGPRRDLWTAARSDKLDSYVLPPSKYGAG